jgi:hypothetical protein
LRHLFDVMVIARARQQYWRTGAAIGDSRALAAINRISRPQTWTDVLATRNVTRARIERALNLTRPQPIGSGMAFLYTPAEAVARPELAAAPTRAGTPTPVRWCAPSSAD